MCNLYKMTKTVTEVAKLFGAAADPAGNAGETVYPGYPGIVVAPDAPTPDHAPDATVLFSSRRRAHEAGGAVRQVVVETNRSFYCDADVWPELNLDEDLFIDGRIINCLVDPATGDALFHGDEPPVVLNRAARRSYLKEKKRRRCARV